MIFNTLQSWLSDVAKKAIFVTYWLSACCRKSEKATALIFKLLAIFSYFYNLPIIKKRYICNKKRIMATVEIANTLFDIPDERYLDSSMLLFTLELPNDPYMRPFVKEALPPRTLRRELEQLFNAQSQFRQKRFGMSELLAERPIIDVTIEDLAPACQAAQSFAPLFKHKYALIKSLRSYRPYGWNELLVSGQKGLEAEWLRDNRDKLRSDGLPFYCSTEKHVYQYNRIGVCIGEFNSVKEAAKKIGFAYGTLANTISRKRCLDGCYYSTVPLTTEQIHNLEKLNS